MKTSSTIAFSGAAAPGSAASGSAASATGTPSAAAPSTSPDGGTAPSSPARAAPLPEQPRDGTHDFDFLEGSWRVHHRRLRRPLSGSSEWYEFEGSAVERTMWDGRANLEEVDAEMPTGRLRALALRLYDPASRKWSIHWSNSATGTLDRPMIGEFRDGRGVFLCQEEYEGRSILQRFIWTSSTPEACRWEQAYSTDRGASWETNWIMEFTRDA